LVYNTYVYPQREEEKDSRMAGFKLGVFYREAHLIGPQESCCSTIGRTQKAVWILAQNDLFQLTKQHARSIIAPLFRVTNNNITLSKD